MPESQKLPSIYALSEGKRPVLYDLIAQLSDEPAPKPEHSHIVVAELEDRIVGAITAERVYCVSNFWVERGLRGRGIAEAMARTIAARNVEGLTEVLCTTNSHVELLAHRFGFVPVKGTLFRR